MLETPALYEGIGNVLHLSLTALCRTHCEAVVEGMGSTMTLHSQNRTKLDVKTVEKETVLRWQAPHPASKDDDELIRKSLDSHFKDRSKWHFCTSDPRAKYFATGKVLTRIHKYIKENTKIPFPSSK